MNEATLTVKCLRMDGMFDIWPARTVSYWPTEALAAAGQHAQVLFERPDGESGAFDRGTVYVMNASGKTIETIHLMANVAGIDIAGPA